MAGCSGRGSTGGSMRPGTGKSVREKPEVIVNQGVKATVGLKVVLRRAAVEEEPGLEADTGGGTGTIVWVDPDDLDGDGQAGDIVQVPLPPLPLIRALDVRVCNAVPTLCVAGSGMRR
eukprot:2513911-Rhodomonas_salina.1